MKVMKPPLLNRQLTLETPARLADGAGGFSESWQSLGTLWGAVQLRSGREASGLSHSRFKITLRAAPEGHSMRPRADQRLVEGPRRYRIDAVHEADPQGRYLTCFAHEEVVT